MRDVNFQSQTQPHSLHSSRNQICDEFWEFWEFWAGPNKNEQNESEALKFYREFVYDWKGDGATRRSEKVEKYCESLSAIIKIFVRNFAGILIAFMLRTLKLLRDFCHLGRLMS